ncbi:MAG: class I SAM-dependent methyltransferase [Terriglobia bacterium]
MERLTDASYWEEEWWKKGRPRRLRLYRDFDYETIRLLRRAAGSKQARMLELGAGGSRILPYLAARFGHEVFGADFSPAGCRLLCRNFAFIGASGSVVCEDLFQPSLRPEQFDVVFSCGLIEHFSDTRAAIEQHVRLLRCGGRVALIVPNLQGLQGSICKRLAPRLWARHRVFGPADLVRILRNLGLRQIRSGYLGSFFLQIGLGGDWTWVQRWPWILQRAAHASARATTGAISLGFRISPLRPHSRTFSTAFFASAVKPDD